MCYRSCGSGCRACAPQIKLDKLSVNKCENSQKIHNFTGKNVLPNAALYCLIKYADEHMQYFTDTDSL